MFEVCWVEEMFHVLVCFRYAANYIFWNSPEFLAEDKICSRKQGALSQTQVIVCGYHRILYVWKHAKLCLAEPCGSELIFLTWLVCCCVPSPSLGRDCETSQVQVTLWRREVWLKHEPQLRRIVKSKFWPLFPISTTCQSSSTAVLGRRGSRLVPLYGGASTALRWGQYQFVVEPTESWKKCLLRIHAVDELQLKGRW